MLLTDCTVKMPNIALFVMYPALIVRLSLPNLTRLKNHKKCIWQFKKHNREKKKKKQMFDKMNHLVRIPRYVYRAACLCRRPPPHACSPGHSPGAQQLPCPQKPHLRGPVGPTLPAHRSLVLSLLFPFCTIPDGFCGIRLLEDCGRFRKLLFSASWNTQQEFYWLILVSPLLLIASGRAFRLHGNPHLPSNRRTAPLPETPMPTAAGSRFFLEASRPDVTRLSFV